MEPRARPRHQREPRARRGLPGLPDRRLTTTDAFLILHGWSGSGPEHWQTWLARELRERAADVSYPALPDPDRPVLRDWLAALDAELDRLGARRTCVLAHSAGAWLWLHHALRRPAVAARRVLLVAPPALAWSVPEFAAFPAPPLDRDAVAAGAAETTLVFARDDPYAPGGVDRDLASLGLPALEVEGGGHLNTDAGYGAWPAVLRWCLEGRFAP